MGGAFAEDSRECRRLLENDDGKDVCGGESSEADVGGDGCGNGASGMEDVGEDGDVSALEDDEVAECVGFAVRVK